MVLLHEGNGQVAAHVCPWKLRGDDTCIYFVGGRQIKENMIEMPQVRAHTKGRQMLKRQDKTETTPRLTQGRRGKQGGQMDESCD